MITEQFQVPGVSCQHCVNAITSEVMAIIASVSHQPKRVRLAFSSM